MTLWKFSKQNLDGKFLILAEPVMEEMQDFIGYAANELTRRCALAEEQMIFEASPTHVLERIRDFCDGELKKRALEK